MKKLFTSLFIIFSFLSFVPNTSFTNSVIRSDFMESLDSRWGNYDYGNQEWEADAKDFEGEWHLIGYTKYEYDKKGNKIIAKKEYKVDGNFSMSPINRHLIIDVEKNLTRKSSYADKSRDDAIYFSINNGAKNSATYNWVRFPRKQLWDPEGAVLSFIENREGKSFFQWDCMMYYYHVIYDGDILFCRAIQIEESDVTYPVFILNQGPENSAEIYYMFIED
jgi:hypothetical protein